MTNLERAREKAKAFLMPFYLSDHKLVRDLIEELAAAYDRADAAESRARRETHEMLTAGGRAIGNTMRWPNHYERAKAVWDAMVIARENGNLGDIPSALRTTPEMVPATGESSVAHAIDTPEGGIGSVAVISGDASFEPGTGGSGEIIVKVEPSSLSPLRDAASEWPDTDDADPWTVLRALARCAFSWEPQVRLIGNIRAADIWRAIFEIERLQSAERDYKEKL